MFSLLAVVLFVGSSLNLNATSVSTTLEEDNVGCFDYADKWATIVGFWESLSHEDEYRVFVKLYDDCMKQ